MEILHHRQGPTNHQADKIIDRNKFPKAVLNEHVEIFLMHITFLLTIAIHPARKAQIASLVAKKVQIWSKYSDFSDVFLEEKVLILPKAIQLNEHAIKLQKGQQLSYRPIYSLGPVELKTLKTYIKTNFANSFIRPSKSSASAHIFFIGKPNGSLRLCVDYQDLNNLTIKN